MKLEDATLETAKDQEKSNSDDINNTVLSALIVKETHAHANIEARTDINNIVVSALIVKETHIHANVEARTEEETKLIIATVDMKALVDIIALVAGIIAIKYKIKN
jgi:hypothetical protein